MLLLTIFITILCFFFIYCGLYVHAWTFMIYPIPLSLIRIKVLLLLLLLLLLFHFISFIYPKRKEVRCMLMLYTHLICHSSMMKRNCKWRNILLLINVIILEIYLYSIIYLLLSRLINYDLIDDRVGVILTAVGCVFHVFVTRKEKCLETILLMVFFDNNFVPRVILCNTLMWRSREIYEIWCKALYTVMLGFIYCNSVIYFSSFF